MEEEKGQTNQSSDAINKSDKFYLSTCQQIIELFSISGDSSKTISDDPILSKVSDDTQKRLMGSITKKHKERDKDIKSSDATSDEVTVDSNILHCVPNKWISKEKFNRSFYDLNICSNFNHLAIKETELSFKDNLQLSSKSKVEANGTFEILPGFSPHDPVTDFGYCFISPCDHSRWYLFHQTMKLSDDGFEFVHLKRIIEPEWDS